MKNFAWAPARSLAEAAAAAATLVADAMVAPADAAASIVKAGGVDVVDLMKEGLIAPAKIVSLRETPGLDAIEAGADGSLRIGAMVTLARLADDAGARKNFPALTDALAGSASPQIRNVATLGGNLLQRPRCWYFRAADYHCLRKGGGHCFAIRGENRYHADLRQSPLRHRPPLERGHRAHRARRFDRARRRRGRDARSSARGFLRLSRSRRAARERPEAA